MGYRIVLRMTWKEPPPDSFPQQQAAVPARGDDDPSYVTKHSDWHFVIVPSSDVQLSDDSKREILWHVPDEKQFRLPVALGEGQGFAWFSYTTIPMQHFLRERLMLKGGDDRLQLALRGLSVVDDGMNTRNSVIPLIASFGDQGFAALDEMIRASDDPTNAIRSLVFFRDAKATTLLVELYQAANNQIHQAAAYSLVHQPYRPEAKEAYLDMIRRQLLVTEAMRASVEFEWKEALPLIRAVFEKPSSLGAYREAYKSYRQLSGKPIDGKLFEAARIIEQQCGSDPASQPTDEQLADARRTIGDSADTEGAAFVGLSLATFVTKGNTAPVNMDGIDILRALPRALVEKMLNQLFDGLEENERPIILKILRQI
jgi:hypothetical protein